MKAQDIYGAMMLGDYEGIRRYQNGLDDAGSYEWYRGVLVLYEACHMHIAEHGLEHLRDLEERWVS